MRIAAILAGLVIPIAAQPALARYTNSEIKQRPIIESIDITRAIARAHTASTDLADVAESVARTAVRVENLLDALLPTYRMRK